MAPENQLIIYGRQYTNRRELVVTLIIWCTYQLNTLKYHSFDFVDHAYVEFSELGVSSIFDILCQINTVIKEGKTEKSTNNCLSWPFVNQIGLVRPDLRAVLLIASNNIVAANNYLEKKTFSQLLEDQKIYLNGN